MIIKYKSNFLQIKEISQEHKDIFIKKAIRLKSKYIVTIDDIPTIVINNSDLDSIYKDFAENHEVQVFNTYDRYCRFNKDVKEDRKVVWENGNEYKVEYEDDKYYYFGQPIENGISKLYKDDLFEIIDKY